MQDTINNTNTNHINKHKRKQIKRKRGFVSKLLKETSLALLGIALIVSAVFMIWIATIKLPDFNDFENRKIANSTKIYDKTGKIVLYNIHDNIKRTVIKREEMNDWVRKATIAIEDRDFYNHPGISIRGILRSVWVAIQNGGKFSQGGSTITQQVIKNSLLTPEKSFVRKFKEWILAVKLDAQLDKETILTMYLNESPYGGNIYGVEEASLVFFGKHAKDLTINEAAYLAALPQSPSYMSPYGNHVDVLESRKNLVLQKMLEQNMITFDEYESNKNTTITFQAKENSNGRAWHFVFYVRDYLEQKYGKDMVENGGLKVITTLDWDLQKQAEEIVKKGAFDNKFKFNAENASLVAIDPKTGQILSMVGSRDYFDTQIDGKYNVATAPRQPGSAFKPIVYTLGFIKGFLPETVLFDLPTQFSTKCNAYGVPNDGGDPKQCYMPVNYDGTFHGPISLRDALQLSLNIPAVKMQYLVGVKSTLDFVKQLGITTLNDSSRFGLSLALGGGEVSLLELTNVYATFANEGVYNKPVSVLEVRDINDNILEKYSPNQKDVIPSQAARLINSVLTDNNARVPEFGINNAMNFYDRPVAAKTGTTNEYRDVWILGYTPSIAVGMWAGNNNNTSIDKKIAGFVVAPIWRKFMDTALKDKPIEYFRAPDQADENTLPILKGVYCSGGWAQTILGYIGPNGATGNSSDSQYNLWNIPIQNWVASHGCPLSGGIINNSTTTEEEGVPVENQIPETPTDYTIPPVNVINIEPTIAPNVLH